MKVTSVLDYNRSVENVRVMLYSAMSMICGHRNIFNDDMYEITEVMESEELYTYKDLLMGGRTTDSPPISPSNVTSDWSEPRVLQIPLLRRGRGERVDACLKSLDTAFEVLDRKALHALRIGFALNHQPPHQLLEQYSFTIKYSHLEDGDREVEGLQFQYGNEINDTDTRSLDIKEVKKLDIDLLDNLCGLCLEIEPLPCKTFLNLSINYSEQDEWTPDGFGESIMPADMASNYLDMQLQEETIGASGNVYHDVSLQARYFKKPDQPPKRCLSHNSNPSSPDHESERHATLVEDEKNHDDMAEDDMEATHAQDRRAMSMEPLVIISDDDESDATLSQYTNSKNSSCGSNAMSSPCPRSSGAAAARSVSRKGALNNRADMSIEEQAVNAAPNLASMAGRSGSSNRSVSHAAEDKKLSDELHEMLESSFNTGSAFETQLRSNAGHELEDQDIPSSLLDKHMAEYRFLTEEKARQLWLFKDDLRRKARPRMADPADEIISCQCQNKDALQETIRCSICDTLQHPVCYGLVEKDTQHPHVCWKCLLHKEKYGRKMIENMSEIVNKRQAVNMLLIEKAVNISALTERVVNANSTDGADLVGDLVGSGYAVQLGARTRRNSPPRLEIPDFVRGPEYLEKLVKLFDPFPKATRHFFSTAEKESVYARLQKALVFRYHVLSQTTVQGSSSPMTRLKRQIDEVSHSETSSKAGFPKRARSDESSKSAEHAIPITPRRSRRQRRMTPKRKEVQSNMFINTHPDASATNSATKIVRFHYG